MTHLPFEELRVDLADAATKVEVGAHYAHYKHPEDLYRVVGFTILEATDEVAVRYSALHEPNVEFARPLANWLSIVEHDGRHVERFQQIS
ncbi:MAG: DUF1653 domain-containing protein [Candidatus Saccharimonadales bacterium]